MIITDAGKIFKFELQHKIDNSAFLKVWSKHDDFSKKVTITEGNLTLDFFCFKVFKKNDLNVFYFSNNAYGNNSYGNTLAKIFNKDFAMLNSNFSRNVLIFNDNVSLVENVSNEEYFFEPNKVVEAVFENAQFSSLKINFEASWKCLKDITKSFENISICTRFFKKLENIFNSKKVLKNFKIINYSLNLEKIDWFKSDVAFSLYSVFYITLNLVIRYFYKIFRKETLSLICCSDDVFDDKKVKTLNYTFKLPDNPIFEKWQSDVDYLKNDFVCYKDACYFAKDAHKSNDVFDENLWEKSDIKKHFSFYNSFYFFKDSVGQIRLNEIKQSLPFLIEKNLLDKVCLSLVSNALPILNSYFVYRNKKFRIVDFNFSFIDGKYFSKIYGVEVLKNFAFDFNSLNWIDKCNIEVDNKNFFNLQVFEFEKEQKIPFEGLVITLPDDDDISIDSTAEMKVCNLQGGYYE